MWASARRHPQDDAVPDLQRRRRQCPLDCSRLPASREGRGTSEESGLRVASRLCCTPRARTVMACVKVLLDSKADINLPDPDGVSPLLLSIMNANWDICEAADPGRRRRQSVGHLWRGAAVHGRSAMRNQVAGGRGSIDPLNETNGTPIVHMLLERGANPNMQLFFRPANLNGVDEYAGLHAADPRGGRRGYGNDQTAAGTQSGRHSHRWPTSRPRSWRR